MDPGRGRHPGRLDQVFLHQTVVQPMSLEDRLVPPVLVLHRVPRPVPRLQPRQVHQLEGSDLLSRRRAAFRGTRPVAVGWGSDTGDSVDGDQTSRFYPPRRQTRSAPNPLGVWGRSNPGLVRDQSGVVHGAERSEFRIRTLRGAPVLLVGSGIHSVVFPFYASLSSDRQKLAVDLSLCND